MYIVAIAWIYVALMMAVVEATSSTGSLLGALMTFVLYGVGPVALVVYLMQTPQRRRAIKAREAEQTGPMASADPDGGGKSTADAVAPVGKEQ
jgi:hypothetical protein